jgi:pSer/pThr/pTyr-binding forkhead associated (FHA) protein
MDETVVSQSNLGKRLKDIKKNEVFEISYKGKKVPLVSKISIGRDKNNTIYLEDSLASRHHALIQKIKDAYFIRDLNSTNGTSVNGTKIPQEKYIKLYTDDIIRIGRTELRIR